MGIRAKRLATYAARHGAAAISPPGQATGEVGAAPDTAVPGDGGEHVVDVDAPKRRVTGVGRSQPLGGEGGVPDDGLTASLGGFICWSLTRSVHQSGVRTHGRATRIGKEHEEVVHIKPCRAVAAPEESIARPSVVLWTLDDAGLNRVAMNVAHERMEVALFLDEECLVAALEEMADAVVSAVEPFGVRRVEPGHDSGQRGLPGANGQVNVVAHEAEGEQAEPELLPVMGQAREVLLPIGIVAVQSPALVSSSGHVVQRARELQARRSRHRSALPSSMD